MVSFFFFTFRSPTFSLRFSLKFLTDMCRMNKESNRYDSDGKESACNAGDLVQSLDQQDSPEKGMATCSSILAWRSP